jgi:phosphoenolpyruvate-protein phosphotransferase (PTS system enzyme I)
MRELRGLSMAGGVAIGRAVCIQTRDSEVYRFPLPEDGVATEIARFEEALRLTKQEMQRMHGKVDRDLGDELAAIFEAHLLMLQDGTFTGRVADQIRSERVNAEWAVHRTVEELEARFARLDDAYLRERNEDLRDVGRQLIRMLRGVSHHQLSELVGDVVVVADDLTPSDAVRLGREAVVGFVVETGGRTSHTAIIARSLNVPLVGGLGGVTQLLTDQELIIVDGDAGLVILHPTAEVLEQYRSRRLDLARRESEALATRDLEARTRDGVPIQLMANIDLPEEISDVARFGAAGVGLYRSEFLYIERSPELPSEEEHLAVYRRLAEAAAPYPAIIRTYDLGGRKLAREVMHTYEENPVLGLRGIRLTLARPDVFRVQLRALYRAALYGDVWVLLPMVSTFDEVRRFRAFAAEITAEMRREGVLFREDLKLGIMIEVPAAALIADLLAREVDFFAIGTNDLIQYALAVDRNNEHVADLYQPLHPAILRMLRSVIEQARAAHIELSLCGEMASDVRYAPLLIGLGLRRLSMSPRLVPAVKTRVRELDVEELEGMVARCLTFRTAAEVEHCAEEYLGAQSLHKEEAT